MKNVFSKLIHILIISIFFTFPVFAMYSKGPVTGFDMPRFASTSTKVANVRSGPGSRYPILWVFQQNVPVKIIDEYGEWRKIVDWDDNEGWIHKLLLTSVPRAIITANITVGRENTSVESSPVVKISKGVVVNVNRCTNRWCEVRVTDKKTGKRILSWVEKRHLWGVEVVLSNF